LPYVNFNIQNCINYAKRINKNVVSFTTSCYTEEGLRDVIDFLKQKIDVKRMITVGIDEVGRGALAGPVVSCAAILKPGFVSDVIVDSKKNITKKNAY